jgi:hypothetical protein
VTPFRPRDGGNDGTWCDVHKLYDDAARLPCRAVFCDAREISGAFHTDEHVLLPMYRDDLRAPPAAGAVDRLSAGLAPVSERSVAVQSRACNLEH